MKKTAIAALVMATISLAACGEKTTIIREVPAAPQSTASIEDSSTMSTTEAIRDAQQTAPSLNEYTDAQMFQFMTTVCDTIDDWAPDYSGYLVNARNQLSSSDMQSKVEITALIIAAIRSVCTWHEAGINNVLGV